jgi:hypothetical protein
MKFNNILVQYKGHICCDSETERKFWRNSGSYVDYTTSQTATFVLRVCLAIKFNNILVHYKGHTHSDSESEGKFDCSDSG